MKYQAIETAYSKIAESLVFRKNGQHIDLCKALDALCDTVQGTETDETVWYIGEHNEATLDALIIGAYWALTEWHGGQHSPEYSTLSRLGQIYSPNTASGPEEGSGEETAYCLISLYFAAKNQTRWDDPREDDYDTYTGFQQGKGAENGAD